MPDPSRALETIGNMALDEGFREALWIAETAANKTPGIKKVTKPLKELYHTWDVAWQVRQNIHEQITVLTRKLERVGQQAEEAKELGARGTKIITELERTLKRSTADVEKVKKLWWASSVVHELQRIEKQMGDDLAQVDRDIHIATAITTSKLEARLQRIESDLVQPQSRSQ
eukprot:1827648-Amphidinium_carterae.1